MDFLSVLFNLFLLNFFAFHLCFKIYCYVFKYIIPSLFRKSSLLFYVGSFLISNVFRSVFLLCLFHSFSYFICPPKSYRLIFSKWMSAFSEGQANGRAEERRRHSVQSQHPHRLAGKGGELGRIMTQKKGVR